MNPIVAYILGPELVWLLMYPVTSFLIARNTPPTEAGNQQLELIGWFLPLVGVLLSFVPLSWAPGSKWLWLLRIDIIGCIALFIVVGYLCGGIDYGDTRNSGLGAAYIMFISLGLLLLFVCNAVAVVFCVTKWRFLPFLKWSLIVVGVLVVIGAVINWLASLGKTT